MTDFSLAALQRPRNPEIASLSDIISCCYQYHQEHNSPFKADYLKNLLLMTGQSFNVVFVKGTHSNFKHYIANCINHRELKDDDIQPFSIAASHLIYDACSLISYREPYQRLLLELINSFLGNVIITEVGKEREADRLRKVLLH